MRSDAFEGAMAVKIMPRFCGRVDGASAGGESARLDAAKLSKMLRGQFRGISEVKMMDCLVRLGRGVKIVGPEGKQAARRVEVVSA